MGITRKILSRNNKTKKKNSFDLISYKLKAKLNNIYSKIDFNKKTYIDSINNIFHSQKVDKLKFKNIEELKYKYKYQTNLAIINFEYDGTISRYRIVNIKDIPKDTRIDNIKSFLYKLCKWIEKTKTYTKINTCLLFWIADHPIFTIPQIDRKLPICAYAQAKGMNNIIIPDGTFTVLSEIKRYGKYGLSWEQQKQLFKKIDKKKKNEIFFRGDNTTIFSTNIREYIYDKLQNEKDNEFKNAMEYEFLTKYNYQSVQEMKQYKFLLNLPGRYAWSTRLKYLYLSHSFIINIREKTIIDNNPNNYHDQFESFIDYIVPDSNCINIDMIHYYSSTNDYKSRYNIYTEKNNEECEKVYNKIKEIYYKYKDKNPNTDKKVIDSYKLINQLKTTHLYEYYYEILLRNQVLGMEPYAE